MSTIVITVVPTELDWLFAGTLQTMRQSMGITLTGLSNASGIPFTRLEVIESGGAATGAERRDITVALTSLSKTDWSRPAEHVPLSLGGRLGRRSQLSFDEGEQCGHVLGGVVRKGIHVVMAGYDNQPGCGVRGGREQVIGVGHGQQSVAAGVQEKERPARH